MKSIICIFSLLILISIPSIQAQDSEKGVIRIYTTPNNVRVIVTELDFKCKKTTFDEIVINEVAEGYYNFKFSFQGKYLKDDFFLPAGDTLSVLADFNQNILEAATAAHLREMVSDLKRDKFVRDSTILSQSIRGLREYTENSNSDSTKIQGDTIFQSTKEDVFYIVEVMPLFNGGEPAIEFRKYISQNLRYPDRAAERGKSGRIIIQFAVDREGRVVDPKIIVSVDPLLDEEAIRVVMSSPIWTPGTQRGEPVKVLFTFPINFVLGRAEPTNYFFNF